MKPGDKVTGVPLGEEMREKHPTITGYYDTTESSLGDSVAEIGFIVIGEDWISCKDIKPAGRRDKETVIE